MHAELVRKIDDIRQGFQTALAALYDIDSGQLRAGSSFARIVAMCPEALTQVEHIAKSARGAVLRQSPEVGFRCAIIGSSNSGKTSMLAEMFPDLSKQERPCDVLITDVKDTTSQAMVIKPGNGTDLVFKSWTLDQIRELVEFSADDLRRHCIEVKRLEDHVEIDGSCADFDPAAKEKFLFGLRQSLQPFDGSYELSRKNSAQADLIKRTTTKVDYSDVRRAPPGINVNGRELNDLQFRVAVRSVEMESEYTEIRRWCQNAGIDEAAAAKLTFVDTPGLVSPRGVPSDEVLQNILARKNQQIVINLLRDDELDVVIHLVLCGNQSDFAGLWSHLEGIDKELLQDLGDRIIVAVNGFNKYLRDTSLTRRWESGNGAIDDDHFRVTIQTNILNRMSTRGALKPISVCFLDVKHIVETMYSTDYGTFYAQGRATVESWGQPGGVGYETLRKLGILDSYQENVEALCDPTDRGQGFLVRQIVKTWEKHGEKLLVRRFVVRSRLLATIRDFRALLGAYYGPDGKMTRQSVLETLRAALSFLDTSAPDAIDKFCAEHMDRFIDEVAIPRAESLASRNELGHSWSIEAFRGMVARVFSEIKARNAGMQDEVKVVLEAFLKTQLKECLEAWGYKALDLPVPTRNDETPRFLLSHALKYHCREFICHCKDVGMSTDDLSGVVQGDEDREGMKELINKIDELQGDAQRLCESFHVQY